MNVQDENIQDASVQSGHNSVPNSQRVAALFLLTFKEKFVIPQTAINFAIGSLEVLSVVYRKKELKMIHLICWGLSTSKLSSIKKYLDWW